MENNENQLNNFQQPVDFTNVSTAKRSPLPWILISAAVLIAGGILAFILLMNNGSSYEKAERKYFAALMASYESLEKQSQQTHWDFGVDIDSAALEQLLGASADLKSFSFSCDSATSGNDIMAQLAAKYGEDELAAATVWQNSKDNSIVMQLPEYITKYLLKYEINTETTTSAIDTDTVKQFIYDAAELYFETVKDSPIEKNVTVTVDNTVITGDKTTIVFTNGLISELQKKIAKLVLANEKYLDLLCSIASSEKDTMTAELNKTISGESGTVEEADEVVFKMYVYTKGDTVLGRELVTNKDVTMLRIFNTSDSAAYFDYIEICDAYSADELGISDLNTSMLLAGTSFTIKNRGTIGANGAKTGTVDISSGGAVSDFSAVISYNDVIMNDTTLSGTAVLTIPAATIKADITMSTDTDSKKSVTACVSAGGINIVKLSCSYSPSTLAYTAAPEVNEENGVIFSTDGTSKGKIDEFAQDLESFYTTLITKEPFSYWLTALPSDNSDYGFDDSGEEIDFGDEIFFDEDFIASATEANVPESVTDEE